MNPHIPLAWLQLTQSRARFVGAIAGIVFTVVFSLVQIAFEDALYASVVMLHSHLRAELVLISPRYQCVVSTESFPERRLYQALAVPGVGSVSPLYMGVMEWKNPQTHQARQIFAVGFKPAADVFDFSDVNASLPRLDEPGTIAFDEGSRPEFGPVAEQFRKTGNVSTELAHRRVNVVSLFRVGANFASDGTIVTSDENFFRLLSFRKPGIVDVGLIRLKPGINPVQARDQVAAALPPDVTVLTREQFMDREKQFFSSSLPVGFFFRTSVLVGLLVGAVIIYQILHSDVSEHLSQYATVKAMGYPDRYLFKVVLQQALILSALGFPPGLLLSWLIYRVAHSATLLPIQMTAMQAGTVYLLTAGMCVLAGVLALRRLRKADPAEIF